MKRILLALSVMVTLAFTTASAQAYPRHSGLFGHHGYGFGNYSPIYTNYGYTSYGYGNYGYASNGYQPSTFRRYSSYGYSPAMGVSGGVNNGGGVQSGLGGYGSGGNYVYGW